MNAELEKGSASSMYELRGFVGFKNTVIIYSDASCLHCHLFICLILSVWICLQLRR